MSELLPSRHPASSPPLRRRLSLEQRLPLLITTLLSTVLAVSLLLTYREIKTSAVRASSERLHRLARQLAERGSAGMATRFLTLHRIAADSVVRRALREHTPPGDKRVMAALATYRVPTDSGLPFELWTTSGARVGGDTTEHSAPQLIGGRFRGITRSDSGVIGRLQFLPGGTYFWVSVPVRDQGRLLGTVVQKRRVAAAPTAERQIRDLTGADISVYYRNDSGEVWTTLTGTKVPAPRKLRASQDGLAYERDGERIQVADAAIAGTPLFVVLESTEAAILARPRAILQRLALIAILLTLAGAAAAWVLSRRLTRPLVQLTTMAEAISRGNYGAAVQAVDDDEIGRLAATFNMMSSQVRESHEELERHYQQTRGFADELERTNRVLEQAVDEAQSANRAKSAFLATMSHEIRTPINAMIGYAELIELGVSGPVTADQRRQLERIRASGQHLIALISEILDFARIESSQITVQHEVGLAADAVDASLSLVRPQAELKGISLSSAGENGVVRYVGDPQRVRQILVNLLTNAVKFTKTGGTIHVTYGTRPPTAHALGAHAPPAGWTCFTVRDNGIGISPNQLEAIFEPFIQGESGYTRRQGGSGLGLSISLSLAHLMHGDVTVTSVPGSGSSFTLWLPAAEVYDAKAAPATVGRR